MASLSSFVAKSLRVATLLGACLTATLLPAADDASLAPVTLVDGDRIALVGDVLIEREQAGGWWETALVAAHPDLDLTVRNLGWSGDTVFGHARAGFGTPADGFKELVKMIRELRPTVVVLGYGMSHSFDGEAGLPTFKKGFDDLVKMLEAGDPKPRLVILSPIRHESYVLPPEAVAKHNEQLALYTNALREEAVARKAAFVDLFAATTPRQSDEKPRPLTDNGVHLTAYGYQATAPAFVSGFGRKGDLAASAGQAERVEALRQAIVHKNSLFFHRWRPQNWTYLFGFRKHEQGNNAVEVPQFDPLIAEAEKKIAALRAPRESR